MGAFNYWIVIFLMMLGFYVVIARGNLVKKIVGLNVFQTSVFILYISMGEVAGGTAPIVAEGMTTYSNPLPHVLILTAIVISMAVTLYLLATFCTDARVLRTDRMLRAADSDDGRSESVVQAELAGRGRPES